MPTTPPPLPALSATTLLRALLKQPSVAPAAPRSSRYRLAALDLGQLARYRAALGFGGSHLPLTWYYLLAQRAHLATMLAQPLPFRLAGAIHVDNALRAFAAPAPGRALELDSTLSLPPPAASGALHAVLATRASQEGVAVFECRSTYLVRRGRRGGTGRTVEAAPPGFAAIAAWPLTGDAGRAYAALSGDWNPIHLWPWSARLMGLRQPIIHGMHTLGRACAELERACGRPLTMLEGRFRAPVALGSVAALAADMAAGRYTVSSAGRLAVEGTFETAQATQDAYPPS